MLRLLAKQRLVRQHAYYATSIMQHLSLHTYDRESRHNYHAARITPHISRIASRILRYAYYSHHAYYVTSITRRISRDAYQARISRDAYHATHITPHISRYAY
jgi:hypothetical protein